MHERKRHGDRGRASRARTASARPRAVRGAPPHPNAASMGVSGWRDERRRRGSNARAHVSRPGGPRRHRRAGAASARWWRAWVRWLRLTLAALVLLAAVSLALWIATTPSLRVRTIRISGTSDPALLATIQRMPLAGCFVLICDPAGDAARIERLPSVARAEVSVVPPDALLVRVTPRLPLLIWRAAGQSYLVAPDGVLIAPATSADLARLPLVDDPSGAAFSAGAAAPGAHLPAALVELAAQLRSALPDMLGASVTLRYEAAHGLVADDGHGLLVAFGDPARPPGDAPDGASGQLATLQAILALLASHGQRAAWIDLRWGMHPAYRLAGA